MHQQLDYHVRYPFSEVENPYFQQMLLCATDQKYDLTLLHSTISSDIHKFHYIAKSWIKTMAQVIKEAAILE